MKQRITIKDLNTLTDEQKERLREWWIPQKGDSVLRDYDKETYIVVRTYDKPAKEDNTRWFVGLENHAGISNKDCLPLLSIGQMMQYIRDRKAHHIHLSDLLWFENAADVLWYNTKNLLATAKTGGEEDAEIDDEE